MTKDNIETLAAYICIVVIFWAVVFLNDPLLTLLASALAIVAALYCVLRSDKFAK